MSKPQNKKNRNIRTILVHVFFYKNIFNVIKVYNKINYSKNIYL